MAGYGVTYRDPTAHEKAAARVQKADATYDQASKHPLLHPLQFRSASREHVAAHAEHKQVFGGYRGGQGSIR